VAEPRYIVDAGPIVDALNRRDGHHVWAKAVFTSVSGISGLALAPISVD
jgi:hypothetical protein